jgi:O-antigen/teichoic acid export membrane protein
VVTQVIRFGTNLLMARLLVPEMFGVMAIATMVMVGLALFSDIGLHQSVVQSKRGNEPAFLNTVWVVQVARGAVLWLVGLGVSLLVAFANGVGLASAESVYGDPSLPYVIAVTSVNAVIMGFQSTKVFQDIRNISLNRVTQIEIASQIAGLLFMLAWVTFDRSVWALVVGGIFANLARTFLSHSWLSGVANHWYWDAAAFREIVHTGKWIFSSSILGFLVLNGDRVLLGALVNATILGLYSIAFLIVNSVETLLMRIISGVLFPALSEIARDRPTDLKAAYYSFHVKIAALAYFFCGILVISGTTLIRLLYDLRYEQSGWMIEVLAVALMTVPYHIAVQCFLALGIAKLVSDIAMIRLVALVVLTPLGFHVFGLSGALWGIALSSVACVPAIIFYARKYKLFDIRKELLPLPAVLLGAMVGKAFNALVGY